MKLQTKFLSLSMISLICALVLVLVGFYTISKTSDLPKTINAIEESMHNQAYRASTSYAIEAEIWHGIYSYKKGDTQGLAIAKDNIQDHIQTFKNSIYPENSQMSAELKRNIEIAKGYFDKIVEKTPALLADPNAKDFDQQLYLLLEIFNEENKINDTVYYQLIDYMAQVRSDTRVLVENVIRTAMFIAGLVIILMCLVPVFSYFYMFKPLEKIIEVMHLVERNGLKEPIPLTYRNDEIGDIAKALEVFQAYNLEKIELEKTSKEALAKAQKMRQKDMLDIANNFEKSIKAVADSVTSSAKKTDISAKDLANRALDIKEETEQLAKTSIKTNDNIQGVFDSTEEFGKAATKITNQANDSREYAKKALKQSDNIGNVVTNLEDKTKMINGVIDIISNISSQIEILSLNAAIEAAKAGDAGKGFTAISGEIKDLAGQAAKATKQVGSSIDEVKSTTQTTIDAIKEISASMNIIGKNSLNIAAAVEEQNNATADIVDRIAKIANMSKKINQTIAEVSKSAHYSGDSANDMVLSAADLNNQALLLQKEMKIFLLGLKKV